MNEQLTEAELRLKALELVLKYQDCFIVKGPADLTKEAAIKAAESVLKFIFQTPA